MAVIVVVLIAALFFMGFFSVYIRNCADSENRSVRPLAIGGGRGRRVARGLDASVIETFPTMIYSEVKEHKIGKGSALECAVCLSEFEDNETLRLLPKCDHVFHAECVDEWLGSHTTCPVCRANLLPQLGDLVAEPVESPALDIEAQHYVVESESEDEHEERPLANESPVVAEVIDVNGSFNRNRTRGSRSNRIRKFSRSHSTGHSVVQPGENTDRFTLRLPVEVRKQVMNRQLDRASSMLILPREGSSRRGFRTGGEGSSRGKNSRRFEKLDRLGKSNRWVFSRAPPFFGRESSMKSPKVAANISEGESGPVADTVRPPV